MPFFALSILSTGPRVTREGECLIARSSRLRLLLTLGAFRRTMVACPRERRIEIATTWLWGIRRLRVVPFDAVREVAYRYENLMPLSSISATDAIDCYRIALVLDDRDEVPLFSWVGQGMFENNSYWPDWMYWQDLLIDFTGTQTSESMAFYEMLTRMLKNARPVPRPAPPPPPPVARPKPAVRPAPPPSHPRSPS